MSLPSCFNLLNLEYWVNIQLQIRGVSSAAELQALINQVFADISLLESTIESQILALGPIAALLEAPTDLAGVLTWIPNFIEGFLTPYFKPYAIYTAQLVAMATQVADLVATIEDVANLKFPGIPIVIPEITISCTL